MSATPFGPVDTDRFLPSTGDSPNVIWTDRPLPDYGYRREGHSALRVQDGELTTFDPHPAAVPMELARVVLLLELIDKDGVCCGLYWAGRSNQIVKSPHGIEVTYNKGKARAIPLSMRDVAEQLAEALNEYTSIPVEMLGRKWCAVEYEA